MEVELIDCEGVNDISKEFIKDTGAKLISEE